MINKINTIFLVIFMFILSACSSIYNKPFINTKETIKLHEDMSEKMVLKEIGQPLYVKSGNSDSDEIIWVYEVRTTLVKSNPMDGEPNKFNRDQKHSTPHHKLQIVFEKGVVKSWGKLVEKEIIPEQVADVSTKKSKKSLGFFLLPKIGVGMHDEMEGLTLGGSLGFGPIGLDLTFMTDDGFAFMLFYEKKYRGFQVQGGVGYTRSEWRENQESQWGGWDYNTVNRFGMGVRLGIAKEIKLGSYFVLRPAYEWNIGLTENKSGFSSISLSLGLRI